MSGQLHAPVALSRGKRSQYLLHRRLGGPQSLSGRRGDEKNTASKGTRTPTPRPSINSFRLTVTLIEEKAGFHVPKTSPGKFSTMIPNLVKIYATVLTYIKKEKRKKRPLMFMGMR
jgi:hypothetical protein